MQAAEGVSRRSRTAGPYRLTPRALVVISGLLGLSLKLILVATTYGTDDARAFTAFAGTIAQHGPIDVYFTYQKNRPLYNHPPLTGYYLWVIDQFAAWFGVSVHVALRVTSSVFDVVSGLMVFELLRPRVSTSRALVAGVMAQLSPVLILISGFHCQTDPIFVMFVLLGSYLLVERNAVVAGVVFTLALSIKVTPVTVLPTVAVVAWQRSPATFLRLTAAATVTFLAIWTPALVGAWHPVLHNVLGYHGQSHGLWGLPGFARDFRLLGVSNWLVGRPGTAVLASASAVIPALLVLRRPASAPLALALALVLTLLLLPAFAVQYLAWAALPALVVDVVFGVAFNFVAGAILWEIYERWAHGWIGPRIILSTGYTASDTELLAALWVVLCVAAGVGMRNLLRAPQVMHQAVTGRSGSAGAHGIS